MNKLLLWGWDRVSRAAEVPDSSLVAFRWILGIYLLLFDARYFAWIDRAPDGLFSPPLISLSSVIGGFPPAPFFTVLDIVGIIAICLMTVGYRTRASTVVVLVTLVVSSTFGYSFGKISHQIALAAVLLCMAVANWGEDSEAGTAADDRRTVPSRRVSQGMALLAVIIAFGFLTAGFDKVRFWVNTDLSESGILSWYYPRMFQYQDPQLLAGLVPGVPLVLLKIGDCAAAIVEVSGFVALLAGRVPWRLWLIVVTALHLANALVLNITFTTQAMVYLAFVTFAGLFHLRWSRFRIPAIAVVGAAGLWHIWARVDGRGSGFVLRDDPQSVFVLDLYVCVGICLIVIGLIANDLRKTVAARTRTPDDRSAVLSG